MTRMLTGQVGTLDLSDLNAINDFYGRDFLPYPFMFTQTSPYATREEALAYLNTVPDRFNHGDLSMFRECFDAYVDADIRVECRVQYIPADTPSVRVISYRRGQLGFVASQQPDVDLLDFYTVSPYDLGAAVCHAVTLTEPGRR